MRTLLARALRSALLPIAFLAVAPHVAAASEEPKAGKAPARRAAPAAPRPAEVPPADGRPNAARDRAEPDEAGPDEAAPDEAAPDERAFDEAARDEAARDEAARHDADVPVKQVVLFSSGVGYFEHFGRVQGNGSTELRFQTEQINDVLKSLILQDLDGGRAGTISYPSQEPIDKTLKSFQVDITANPGLEELLNQLRGARLTVNLGADAPVTGMIVGVQKRPRPVPPDAPAAAAIAAAASEVWVLNLKTGRTIRAIPMDDVREFSLEDPRLDAELEQALSALAQSRDQDKKPVTISFRGEGERRVRIGYVVETPIWKTSYRLILGADDDGEGENQAGEGENQAGEGENQAGEGENQRGEGENGKGPETGRAGPDAAKPRDDARNRDAAPNPNDAAQQPRPQGGSLQGWAIVENQTDSDWTDVQLSLVSGRPISFIQHLSRPLYVPRPVVWPDLFASLRPQTYKGGITAEEFERIRERGDADDVDGEEGMSRGESDDPDFSLGRVSGKDRASGGGGGGLFGDSSGQEEDGPMDPTASVIAAASAGQLGELFQYTVGNVTLPRQQSAMIPIVTDALEVERVSIYNPYVLQNHPLSGARLKNTTGKHLLQGPITVLDAGAYAGDARIDDVPPGQERLLSYGVDLQVIVQQVPEPAGAAGTLESARLVKGVLELQRKDVHVQAYAAQNKSAASKLLVFEIESPGPGYRLIEPPAAEETTEQLYRFDRAMGAGKGLRFKVVLETERTTYLKLGDAQMNELEAHVVAEGIPAEVRTALQEAVDMRRALSDVAADIAEREAQIASTTAEQERIRENMKSVSEESEYYLRLVKKLDEQETGIETTQAELKALRAKQSELSNELAEYLANLDVG